MLRHRRTCGLSALAVIGIARSCLLVGACCVTCTRPPHQVAERPGEEIFYNRTSPRSQISPGFRLQFRGGERRKKRISRSTSPSTASKRKELLIHELIPAALENGGNIITRVPHPPSKKTKQNRSGWGEGHCFLCLPMRSPRANRGTTSATV